MWRRIAVKPSTRKSISAVTASKKPAALSCSQVIQTLTQRPRGTLGSVNQLSNAVPPTRIPADPLRTTVRASRGRKELVEERSPHLQTEALLDRVKSRLAVERRHAIEPGGELRRIGLEPLLGCLRPLVAVGENLVHHKILDVDGIDEIADKLGRVGALLGPATALVCVHNR